MNIIDFDDLRMCLLLLLLMKDYDQLNKSRKGALHAALAANKKYLDFMDKTSVVSGNEKEYTTEGFRAIAQVNEMIAFDISNDNA